MPLLPVGPKDLASQLQNVRSSIDGQLSSEDRTCEKYECCSTDEGCISDQSSSTKPFSANSEGEIAFQSSLEAESSKVKPKRFSVFS